MKIVVVITTDGRGECLLRTTRALQEHLIGNIDYSLLIDDSGSLEYAQWLDSMYPSFQMVHHVNRRGFAGAVISAWENLPECDYVLTVEDDLVLTQDVRVSDLITVLAANPSLAQVVLLRNPVNEHELAAGGVIQLHPEAYTQRETQGIAWLEQHMFYSTNVNLMPYHVTRLGWPNVEHSEGIFGAKLRDYGYSFAYLGTKEDAPRIEHIGYQRVGVYY